MANALDLSTKEVFQTIRFQYGDTPTLKTYTDRSSDYLADDGLLYVSLPNLQIKLPENEGGITPKEIEVTMPLDPFTNVLSNGAMHAPVRMIVREYNLASTSGPGSSVKTTFVGRVTKTIRNHQGQSNMVLIQGLPLKSLLEFALGLACDHECEYALGDALCKVDMIADGRTQVGNIAAIDGKQVTITGLSTKPDRFWHLGYARRDGLPIMIREWRDTEPETFHFVRRPPTSWLGQNVFVFAGCDKSKGTCGGRFNNEENFGGAGFAILPYNPNFEDPG